MITNNLLKTYLLVLALLGPTVNAHELIALTNTAEGASYIASDKVAENEKNFTIEIIRDYNKKINLGKDPITGQAIFPHQSVRITYSINCAESTVSLRSWKLFSGRHALGESIWVDRNFGSPHFYSPMTGEELKMMTYACGGRRIKNIARNAT